MIRRFLALVCAACVASVASYAQGPVMLDSVPRTYFYSGIGPLSWMPAKGLNAFIATPEFSDGPRVLCNGSNYRCEIDVALRNMSYYARTQSELLAEVKEQFAHDSKPLPSDATFQTILSSKTIAATFLDLRPGAEFRFTMMALVFNGPAVMQVELRAADMPTINRMLSIATTAKVEELPGMLAYRFGQFASTCEQREPATKVANAKALAASPFTYDVMLKLRAKYDSTMTADKLNSSLAQALSGFLTTYDELSPQNKATFCKALPKIIADAARELPPP